MYERVHTFGGSYAVAGPVEIRPLVIKYLPRAEVHKVKGRTIYRKLMGKTALNRRNER